MPIENEKRKIIIRCLIRLIRKNSGGFRLIGTAIKGLFAGNLTKQVTAPVFSFNPDQDLPVEVLIAESIINSLTDEDIEEVFSRYAARKGLSF